MLDTRSQNDRKTIKPFFKIFLSDLASDTELGSQLDEYHSEYSVHAEYFTQYIRAAFLNHTQTSNLGTEVLH